MFTFTTSDVDLTNQCKRVRSVHVEAGALAAVVYIRNGGASGAIFLPIKVPANTSENVNLDTPINFPAGVYIDTDANVVRGSLAPA